VNGIKVCIASSAGGHLTETIKIARALKYDTFFISFNAPNLRTNLKDFRYYTVTDPERNPLKLVVAFFQTLKIMMRERPDAVITSGAGVALPACYIGKLMGAKLIYVECGCRVETASVTGRLLYPIADLFILQWKASKRFFPKAKYGGLI